MGCLRSTKRFFVRILTCRHGDALRPLNIGHPTNFRKEDPFYNDPNSELRALILEKAAADASSMMEECRLKGVNGHQHIHPLYQNRVGEESCNKNREPHSTSLRSKVKHQTHRLSLGLLGVSDGAGGDGVNRTGYNNGCGGNDGGTSDTCYKNSEFADSACEGILRCGMESGYEAVDGKEDGCCGIGGSTAPSDYDESRDSVAMA